MPEKSINVDSYEMQKKISWMDRAFMYTPLIGVMVGVILQKIYFRRLNKNKSFMWCGYLKNK